MLTVGRKPSSRGAQCSRQSEPQSSWGLQAGRGGTHWGSSPGGSSGCPVAVTQCLSDSLFPLRAVRAAEGGGAGEA